MCHNTLRSLPDSVRGLHSLTYLDLRSNQLSVLPREICFLPLHVLLVSNNRLVSLPEELGRMDRLTELDAACNQMSHLPARMSDLHALRALSLRSNQLVYLPREVTYLSLVALDISNNRIASLPVELRIMTTLVSLELDNNPLTSPPASVCVRGLVHVFKYLETVAAKEERIKSGGSLDGHGTLRRSSLAKQQQQSGALAAADPAHSHKYNTLGGMRRPAAPASCGVEQQHAPYPAAVSAVTAEPTQPKWSPTHQPYVVDMLASGEPATALSSRSSTPAMSPMNQRHVTDGSGNPSPLHQQPQPHNPQHVAFGHGDESSPSPDGGDGTPDSQRSDEKLKMTFNNMQSYREYKEALRQQRNADTTAVYRPKEDSGGGSGNHVHFATPECAPAYKPPAAPHHHSNHSSSSTSQSLTPEPYAPAKPAYANGAGNANSYTTSPLKHQQHGSANGSADEACKPSLKSSLSSSAGSNKTYQTPAATAAEWAATNNGNPAAKASDKVASYNHYVKPSSPCKSGGTAALGYNSVPGTNGNQSQPKMTTSTTSSSSSSSGSIAMAAASKPTR